MRAYYLAQLDVLRTSERARRSDRQTALIPWGKRARRVQATIPPEFGAELKRQHLIDQNAPTPTEA